MNPYLPVLIIIGIALVVGAALSTLSSLMGPKHRTAVKEESYECGVPLVTTGKERMSVKFYLTAILFILFDIETVFLYLWAKVFRDLGWFGITEIAVFLLILLAGFVYIIRRGALEWD